MIAVLATYDAHDYPFLITKFNKENEEVISIEVHWYATNTHPFDGVYKAEMMVEKRIYRKKKKWSKNKSLPHLHLEIKGS